MKKLMLLALTATSLVSNATDKNTATSLLEVDLSSPLKGECLEYRTEFRDTRTDVLTFFEKVQNERGLLQLHESTLDLPFSIKSNIEKIDYISTGQDRVGVLLYKCLKYKASSKNNNSLLHLKINPRNSSCKSETKVLKHTTITTKELENAIKEENGFEFENFLYKADRMTWNNYSQKVSSIDFIKTVDHKVGVIFNYCKNSLFKDVLNDVVIGENDNSDREDYARSEREFRKQLVQEITKERLSRIHYRFISKRNNSGTEMKKCRSKWDFISNGAIFRRTKEDCSSFTIIGDGGVLRYRGSL